MIAGSALLPSGHADHPVTRLIDLGAATLTSAELLAILVHRNGERHASRAAADILATVDGSLRRLASDYATTLLAMRTVRPLRSARQHAATLQAAFELGRRRAEEQLPAKPCLATPAAVVRLMAPRLRDLPAEEFHTLALDVHHHLEHDTVVTRGLLDSTPVDPRAAFRRALAERAASVVFVHNHPSGDPTPSPEDRATTAQLVGAGWMLGITVRDHVIIGGDRYTSFAEAGYL
jgi:DNA repair protein RadC